MPSIIKDPAPTGITAALFEPYGQVTPSPADWRDQIFYFLLPDRFSNNLETGPTLFDQNDPQQYKTVDKTEWMEGGKHFQGGKLKGIQSKLKYLTDLGVTALWIGPVFKQRADMQTYHGYGIQNFLDVDPRFGTRKELRDLINEAHVQGIYVILDVIYNHTGNNWYYSIDGKPWDTVDYRFQPPYAVYGWRSGNGSPIPQAAGVEDGAWPVEFQNKEWYTRAGRIGNWDAKDWECPMHPDTEFRRGDFGDLKDLNLDYRDDALLSTIGVYKYWIALLDVDGFRIDTVKHSSFEVCKNFCGAIHEYAESIGKDNFFLVGEVAGGVQMAKNYLDIFGRNIDAVLDIGKAAENLSGMVKGFTPPTFFFEQFKGHDILGSHRETGRYHLSILDDHDMIGRTKKRFAAQINGDARYTQTAHAVGTMLTTIGIPCIYYGTEQAFDGGPHYHDENIEPKDQNGNIPYDDRYLREAMFGGSFGAFETKGCHFFNPDHPTYLRIAAIARIRNQKDKIGLALRRGRQYQRKTRIFGDEFYYPDKGELIAWSRLLDGQEVLVALNSNGNAQRGAWVTVHAPAHPNGSAMKVLYRSNWGDAALKTPPNNETLQVAYFKGRATVRLDLPPAGMVVLV